MLERKTSLWLGLVLGTAIGALTPGLWSVAFFSYGTLLWSVIGAVVGLYVAHRLSQ